MTTNQLLFGQDFEAVIFDFDGTLVDSHEAMLSAYGTWAEEFGISLELLPQFLGMPNTALAEQVLPAELVPTAVARIEQLEVQSPEGVVPLPGALEALRLLGSAAGIATSCTMPLLVARSEAARLELPEVLVTRDQVENGKPAPDTFLAAAERLGVRPERALVVEDAPAGVAAARAAGCAVLGILSTLDAATLGADVSVKDLSHISWQLSDGTISLW